MWLWWRHSDEVWLLGALSLEWQAPGAAMHSFSQRNPLELSLSGIDGPNHVATCSARIPTMNGSSVLNVLQSTSRLVPFIFRCLTICCHHRTTFREPHFQRVSRIHLRGRLSGLHANTEPADLQASFLLPWLAQQDSRYIHQWVMSICVQGEKIWVDSDFSSRWYY